MSVVNAGRAVRIHQRLFDEKGSYAGRKLIGRGTFLAFSTEFEELSGGVGQFPVAIVEHEDGTMQTYDVGMVDFETPTPVPVTLKS